MSKPDPRFVLGDTTSKVRAARDQAAVKAWDSLARYKFHMFGYWAAHWVKYNQLLPKADQSPNPFSDLVTHARERQVNTDVTKPAQYAGEAVLVQLPR